MNPRQLLPRWFGPEDLADLRLLGYWLAVCAGSALLAGVLAVAGPALDRYDAWRARAAGQQQALQDAHWLSQHQRQQLAAIAAHRATVQAQCGPEAVCTPGRTGAGVCTTRRGMASTVPCTLAPIHLAQESRHAASHP